MHTGSNKIFVREWFEPSINNIGFNCRDELETAILPYKWYPYNKGGSYRKWYGNQEKIVNWKNRGQEIHDFHKIPITYNGAPVRAKKLQFRESITWSFVSSSYFGVRYSPPGFMFDVGGSSLFLKSGNLENYVGFLCSKLSPFFLSILNPTLNFQVGNIANLPMKVINIKGLFDIVKKSIDLVKLDWESYEISWDFSKSPLLNSPAIPFSFLLQHKFKDIRAKWERTVKEIKQLEKENNRIFINAYGLSEELTPEVPLDEITLTCNPHYRYKGNRSEKELEALLLADTMKKFINYGVGCMFGRYSLGKEGLILANAGETLQDYLKQVPEPTFTPDEDNVIPVLEGEWFDDDIAERFKDFLKITFGEAHFEENLSFLEEAIGREIRSYFVKDFYKHHVRMYKKRPIYWLFSSPKGNFNALIYIHRYRPDTVSIILNDYLVQYREKLTAYKALLETRSISASANQGEKTKAIKEINKINKVLSELKEYEDEILYPLATRQIEIDLDDGVKVNYNKFGKALKKVPGLSN